MHKTFITLFVNIACLFCLPSIIQAETPPMPVKIDQPHADSLDPTDKQLIMLDNLIAVTQENLNNQKALKQMIQDYQKLQYLYLQNPKDNEVLYHMVKAAHHLLEGIKANHLTQTFDKDFLSELTLFSNVANKRGIPKP